MILNRKDSFITHRAFCDALAEESARLSAAAAAAAASSSSNPIIFTSQLPGGPAVPPPPSSSNPINISQSTFTIIDHQLHDSQSNPPPPPPLFPNFSPHRHISLLPNWEPPRNRNPTHNNINSTCSNIKTETIQYPPPPPPALSSSFYQEPPLGPPPSSSTTTASTAPPLTHKNFNTSAPFLHVVSSTQSTSAAAHMSATALLQRAATVGAQPVGHVPSAMMMMMGEMSAGHVSSTAGISPEYMGFTSGNMSTWQKSDRLTRDFLGLTGGGGAGGGEIHDVNVNVNVRKLLTLTRGVEFPTYDRDHSLLLKPHGFGFAEQPPPSETWGNC